MSTFMSQRWVTTETMLNPLPNPQVGRPGEESQCEAYDVDRAPGLDQFR